MKPSKESKETGIQDDEREGLPRQGMITHKI